MSKAINWLLLLLLFPIFAIAQPSPQFRAIPASYNINSPNPLYALDINYDDLDIDRQAFHLFLPDTTGTYPLVIYIHGGGFTGGSRDVVLENSRMSDLKYFLEHGVAYASIGYRLIATGEPDAEGVIKSLSDSKRALQFIRHYAPELHIDPDKIVLSGSSAGAGTSLWLATHPDMAAPNATDPVLRSSTRVCAAHLSGSQATYDLYKWETEVYDNFDGQDTAFTLDSIVNLLSFERASNFYGGLDSLTQIFHDPTLIQYRQDVDMLFHLSSDAPPLYLENTSLAVHPSDNLFHHAFHGKTIFEHGVAAGVSEVKALVPYFDINTTQGESINEFLLRQLNSCSATTTTSQRIVKGEVNAYPNPTNSQISINLPKGTLISSVKLFSISGRLVLKETRLLTETVTLSTSSMKPGIYIMHVTDETGIKFISKVIVE